jgi:succinate-semialdehyde dehydrogenase/glutarate-semialdehyde dehydrogenase
MTQTELLRQACYIGGEWIGADDGRSLDVNNPANGAKVGSVPHCRGAETVRAIDAAAAAFPDWRQRSAASRAGLMHKLADLIVENIEPLARLLTLEMGKPLDESRGEINGGVAYVRWFAEEGKRIYGDVIPSPWPDRRLLVMKQPVGVVGAITPWNFPHSMISRKLGAALAAGCTMVIKPAPQTPFSALAIAALAEQAGFPAGVLNVITGEASEIGAAMINHPKLRKITFTGSTAVGKQLASAATAQMKRVSMELGGNAPFIVFDDADLDAAVEGAMISKFRNTGQTCVCTNRFLVQDGVYDAFAAKLVAAAGKLKVGDGFVDGVTQGPLVNRAAVDKVQAHIADARTRGGRVLLGGEPHALGGLFFQPTVITEVAADALLMREETFGPLAPLIRFHDEAEAIRLANATEYGLASYFYSRDLGRVFRVMEQLEYGLVGVNTGMVTTEVAPFGGVKSSGMGREGSKYGVDDYLDIKYGCLDLGR